MKTTNFSLKTMVILIAVLALQVSSCGDGGSGGGGGGGGAKKCRDFDGDGFFAKVGCGTTVDCDDSDPDNWTSCATCVDTDSDNWYAGCNAYINRNGPDCNNVNPDIYPGASELCDIMDNQCPGDAGYGKWDEGCVPGMAMIPSGCFYMGDDSASPIHKVCLIDFYIDIYEVTNQEYADCVSSGGCTPPVSSSSDTRASYYGNATYDNFPVINVDWYQATGYCAWAGKRLLTEAEWEYAARGGLSGKIYPWGDTISGSDANYMDSGDAWDNDTSPVGHYAANSYGIFDMAGNVREWVNDWYSDTYYSVGPGYNPTGPATGIAHVIRGGCWANDPPQLRVAKRTLGDPVNWPSRFGGFRCAGD